jgi:hypothetical protein
MTFLHTPVARAALSVAVLTTAAIFGAGHAYGWGHSGHVFIGEAAIMNMVRDVPEFWHDDSSAFDVGELAAEADISKSAGDAATPNSDVHDLERDPGHFIDLDDSGYDIPAAGYPQVDALKLSNLLAPGQGRRDFDTLLRNNTPAGFASQPTQYVGYLPYNIVDQWEQIRKDFAYLRAFKAAIANPATAAADRDYFKKELVIRRRLLVRDVGYWAHFVGDASQPMHVSIHFNGWGTYPNPQGYTTSPIHAPFEGVFVKNNIKRDDVSAAMAPYKSCEDVTGVSKCAGIEPRVRAYLQQTLNAVIPLYELTKSLGNGNPWTTKTPTPAQKAFVVARLAAGANELRDEIVDAWHSSDTIGVGYPLIKVSDIESGAVVWTASAFAAD